MNIHKGKEHPICFWEKVLHNNELWWHIMDKDGVKLLEGMQNYLAGSRVECLRKTSAMCQ